MMIKKQCYTSVDLTAALSLALFPPAPCGFLPWPFPSLKSVGALSLEKSPRVQRCTGQGCLTFCPRKDHGVGELVSKKRRKMLNLVQMQSKHFFFLSFFFF